MRTNVLHRLLFVLAVVCVGASVAAAAPKPVKVFILAGQSNMEGPAVADSDPTWNRKDYNQGRGTLEQVMKDPAKADRYKHLRDDRGRWAVREDVWVHYKLEDGTVRCGPLGLSPAPAAINFRSPAREYEEVRVREWTLLVEKQLLSEDAPLARRAIARLDALLGKLFAALPGSSHPRLGKLRLFLMYGEKSRGGGRDNGLEYFQKSAPEHFRNLDPRMSSAVLIYSAENWVWLPERRALMALTHEFAHAHQLEQWPEKHPPILAAWENAVRRGLYRGVKDEDGKTLREGYALANQLEYFAELSAVYFVGGYYRPFRRAELKGYDPDGYRMVEQMWKIADRDGPSDLFIAPGS